MVKVQSIWDDPAVTVMAVKFGLVAVADGYGPDTSSQGEYYYYNLVETLPPKWERGGKCRGTEDSVAVHRIRPS